MTWAKIDDRANEHRKQLAAGAEACWLWVCGLMYCKKQAERDGFIPETAIWMLFPVKNPKKLAQKLVEVELWERVEGGYHVHEYEEWNPTKEQIEADRESGRQRARASYARKKESKTGCSSGEESPKNGRRTQGSSGEEPRARAHACALDPDPRSEIRDPNLAQTQSKDLTGQRDRFAETFEFVCPDSVEFTEKNRTRARRCGKPIEELYEAFRNSRRLRRPQPKYGNELAVTEDFDVYLLHYANNHAERESGARVNETPGSGRKRSTDDRPEPRLSPADRAEALRIV